MTGTRVTGVVLLCGLAFWLGRATGRSDVGALDSRLAAIDERLAAQARTRGGECLGAVAALGNHRGWSPQEMEQAVARALASERPSTGTAGATGEQPAEPRPTSAKAAAALERGQQILASAAAQRRWTAKEAEAFHGVLPDLDTTSRDALMAEFSRAVNNDEFSVDIVGPPF